MWLFSTRRVSEPWTNENKHFSRSVFGLYSLRYNFFSRPSLKPHISTFLKIPWNAWKIRARRRSFVERSNALKLCDLMTKLWFLSIGISSTLVALMSTKPATPLSKWDFDDVESTRHTLLLLCCFAIPPKATNDNGQRATTVSENEKWKLVRFSFFLARHLRVTLLGIAITYVDTTCHPSQHYFFSQKRRTSRLWN